MEIVAATRSIVPAAITHKLLLTRTHRIASSLFSGHLQKCQILKSQLPTHLATIATVPKHSKPSTLDFYIPDIGQQITSVIPHTSQPNLT